MTSPDLRAALIALRDELREWLDDAEIGAGYNSGGVYNTMYLDTVNDWRKRLDHLFADPVQAPEIRENKKTGGTVDALWQRCRWGR